MQTNAVVCASQENLYGPGSSKASQKYFRVQNRLGSLSALSKVPLGGAHRSDLHGIAKLLIFSSKLPNGTRLLLCENPQQRNVAPKNKFEELKN